MLALPGETILHKKFAIRKENRKCLDPAAQFELQAFECLITLYLPRQKVQKFNSTSKASPQKFVILWEEA